jgi:hypothetical protein
MATEIVSFMISYYKVTPNAFIQHMYFTKKLWLYTPEAMSLFQDADLEYISRIFLLRDTKVGQKQYI